MAATIKQLETELLTLVRAVPVFTECSFSAFSINDLEVKSEHQGFPLAGVGYNGCYPLDQAEKGKNVGQVHAMSMVDAQFLVMIGIQYQFAGQVDNKQQAMDLLDQLRSAILGFKGVNSRPWRFIGERPEPEADADGVVFYSQVWHTAVPVVGTFNNP